MELYGPSADTKHLTELKGAPVSSNASLEPEQMRHLVERLAQLVAGGGGKFVVAAYGEDPKSGATLRSQIVHISNNPGCADEIIHQAAKLAETPGLNVYMAPIIVHEEVPVGQRGTKNDVLASLAIVFDFDDTRAANWKSRLPALEPHAVVETSMGRFQVWFLLDAASSPDEVERLAQVIVEHSGADACWSREHTFRLPGLLNWANRDKQKKTGRGPKPVRSNLYLDQLWWPGHSLKDIRTAVVAKWPCSLDPKPIPRTHDPSQPRRDFSEEEINNFFNPTGEVDRSARFFTFVQHSKRRGYAQEDTVSLAISHQESVVMEHFNGNMARVEADVRRIWEKASVLLDPAKQYSEVIAATKSQVTDVSKRKWSEANFIRSEKGFIVAYHQHNIVLALFLMQIQLRYNRFQNRSLITMSDGQGERHLDDASMADLWLTVDRRYGFRPTKDFFWTVIEDLARKKPFHPVVDYLRDLEWDGQPRLDTWLSVYGGAEDSEYTRAVGAITLIAAVRRVRRPGSKFDEMLVLESKQGSQKSTAFKTLAGEEWFTDDLPLDADSKRVIENTAGRWIIEAAELKGMRLSDVEHLKSFLSRQADRARLAYGRLTTEVPRQFIVVGTTNSSQYLRDSTGNRRFWPVKVGTFNIEALKRDRDQILAEAAVREANGESIRLDPSLYKEAAKEQELRLADDPFVEILERALQDRKGKIASLDIWKIIGIPQERRTQNDNARMGEAMRKLGWERGKARFNGKTDNGYFRGTKRERQGLELTVCGQGDRALVVKRSDLGDPPG
jgi:predicted P-loop ATPase